MEDKKLNDRLAKIKHKFIVLSGKGGVGKSTIAANLALAFAKKGFKTGLLDVDVHGPSIPKMFGAHGAHLTSSGNTILPYEYGDNLKVISVGLMLENSNQPVIWRGPLKYSAIKQFIEEVEWGELDYLVVDCPPGTGDEPLSVVQLLGSNCSGIIVTTPQQVATVDVAKCINFCDQLKLPVKGIIENMSGFICPHCNEEVNIFSSGGGEKLSKEFNVDFLGKIPIEPGIVKSGDEGKPYLGNKNDTIAAEKFREIIDSLIEKASSSMP